MSSEHLLNVTSSKGRWLALLAFGVLAGIFGLEWYLEAQKREVAERQPNYWRLQEAHAPFAVKYPHPDYGFFFSPELLRGGGPTSANVQLSEGGFRGPGPDHAGGRALAFVVGNSVVFGFVPHDSLTLTGFLNRMQSRYFFVNAGVPSWTSLQMRRRAIQEMLVYDPALIVFWGGNNDASLALRTTLSGRRFTPETIEEPAPSETGFIRALTGAAPNLTGVVRKMIARLTSSAPATPNLRVAAAAGRAFAANVDSVFSAASEKGVRLLAVYQPILHHHAHRPPGLVPQNQLAFFESFHRAFVSSVGPAPLLDLSSSFDPMFGSIPVFRLGRGPDLRDQVFVDTVHLYVPGNQSAAAAITAKLGLAEAMK